MSFLTNAFGGNNNYNVTAGLPAGTQVTNNSSNLNNAYNIGYQNYQNSNAGLNQLAGMLQQQAAGQGPNLANQQLQNFTGQNVANTAALMAGQRGASANPGLLARQVGQQGAATQQQAAGQASQNALAQQLAAQQQLGSVYGTMGSLANQAGSTAEQGLTNLNGQIINANLGASEANAQAAQQNSSQNSGLLGGALNSLGGIAGLAGSIGSGVGSLFGGGSMPSVGSASNYLQGPGSGIQMVAAEGGEVEKPQLPKMSISKVPKHLEHIARIRYGHMFSEGGEVSAMVSPGEKILSPKDVKKVESGSNPMKLGEKVPGKPKHPGNDYRNDTVHKNIKEHSIVLPNSITNHPNAPQLAYDFVARVKAGHHKRK